MHLSSQDRAHELIQRPTSVPCDSGGVLEHCASLWEPGSVDLEHKVVAAGFDEHLQHAGDWASSLPHQSVGMRWIPAVTSCCHCLANEKRAKQRAAGATGPSATDGAAGILE